MKNIFLIHGLLLILFVGCKKESTPSPDPEPEIQLQTDSTELTMGGSANSLDSLLIQSNSSWTISLSPASTTWLTLSATTGNGDVMLYVTAQKNPIELIRSVTMTITPDGDTAKAVKIVITQKPASFLYWSKLYGGSDIDQLFNAVQTPDGGFIAVGQTRSKDGDVITIHGNVEMWVLKVNANGEKLWQKTFGGENDDLGSDIFAMPDGSYWIIGKTRSNFGDVTGLHGKTDVWVVKIDGQGNKLGQKTYGGSNDDQGGAIIPTTDGNYFLAASTSSTDGDATVNHGGSDTWLIKVDGDGKILWQKTYGGSNTDSSPTIVSSPGGGYLMTVASISNDGDVGSNNGNTDLWVLKIDDNGNKVWGKTFGGTKWDVGGSVMANQDGSYLIAGSTESNDGDIAGSHGRTDGWLIKIDALGNLLWQRTYGGTMYDQINDMIEVSNGDYVLMGQTSSLDGDVTIPLHGLYDTWVIKIDKAGTILWQKTYGGTETELTTSIIATTDGAFLLSGFSQSNDGDVSGYRGSADAWLMKTSVP